MMENYCLYETHTYDPINLIWLPRNGIKICNNPDCKRIHRYSNLKNICKYGENCNNYLCEEQHPPERKKVCPEGASCWYHLRKLNGYSNQPECNYLHPKILNKLCKWDYFGCQTYGCSFIHNPNDKIDCPYGSKCSLENCPNKHPKLN